MRLILALDILAMSVCERMGLGSVLRLEAKRLGDGERDCSQSRSGESSTEGVQTEAVGGASVRSG